MRIIAFFLAFTVLTLSMLPCADEAIAMNTEKIEISIDSDHEKDQEHNDACSPFCICTCCSVISINHIFDNHTSLSSIVCKKYISFLPIQVSKVPINIWHPPQLV